MPTIIEQKAVDPEAELSNALRIFQKLYPMCSVDKRAGGVPQLAPQEKQLDILANELKETVLCINLGKKGQHAVRDNQMKNGTSKCIVEYDHLENELRDEKSQLVELDCLNYLAQKQVIDLRKEMPSATEELSIIENAQNRLKRMENRLDMATKRFCIVNNDNKTIREEIHRLLVERNCFNNEWNRTISKLIKGKMYLMDILEIANMSFADRDESIRKLEALKWKGLYQLNRDISEMQSFECELNHLAKLEAFLRVKGSRRVCEADEIEEAKRQADEQKARELIAWHDHVLDEIFAYAGSDSVAQIIRNFATTETTNFSTFVLLCDILQESIIMRRELEGLKQRILDQRDINEAREEKQDKRIAELKKKLAEKQASNLTRRQLNEHADQTIARVLRGIDELVRISRCNVTPLLTLLGNHKEVTKWNVTKFLRILEVEVKSLIEVAYGAVKPPPPMPQAQKGTKGVAKAIYTKIVNDPHITPLRPNKIEKLVPYLPCAYCVEDYIMNQVFETPAVPGDRDYVETIFHLEDDNTKFGIFTLTVPLKRHPYSGNK